MANKLGALGCLAAMFVTGTDVLAQSFTVEPNDTLWVNAPIDGLSIYDIYQTNTTGYPIDLGWDSVLVDLPEAWDYSTCDLGHCYPGIPSQGGTMLPVEAGEQGFLGVNVIPNGVSGSGIVQLRVFDLADPGNPTLLTWMLSAGAVGVAESFSADDVMVFPVPAIDQLQVRLNTGANAEVRVHDVAGHVVDVPVSRAGSSSLVLDVAALRSGFYVLELGTAAGIVQKSFLKQ